MHVSSSEPGSISDRESDQSLIVLANEKFGLDIIFANTGPLPLRDSNPARVLLNDGSGKFQDGTTYGLPPTVSGVWFDVEVANFDGDERLDLYFSSRGGPDRLVVWHGD